MKVFKNAWFGRFARKEKISADALWDAVERAENGHIDADLGGGVIKQRIARPGEGKSKGYRSIVIFCKGELSFFVYGFSKSELGNIREDEEEQFKKMARHVLSLTEARLNELVANGQFEEVAKNA
ncbi:MAG: type II toxin-antitoxin system RelE/ParE family toxin [Gallionella sp.]|nr:type II toxin-antitoxin system RelE/ParE family toxin [Gallionella sp.]